MRLGELQEHEQYEVCKMILDGREPMFRDDEITMPNSITVRYTCANHECKRLLTPSYYYSSFHDIPDKVRCPTCGNWATRHFMGATVDLFKEVKRKVQKRMTDYNQPQTI